MQLGRSLVDAIAVIGLPQHGKSTFARMLSELSGKPNGATSRVILDFLSRIDGIDYGTDWHTSVHPGLHSVFRERLVKAGDALCAIKPSILAEALINQGCGIVEGIRRKAELDATRLQFGRESRFMLVVWVDRPDHGLITDNTTVTKDDANVVITNSTLEQLEAEARRILGEIKWPIIKQHD